MDLFDASRDDCGVYKSFDLLGKKWSLPMLIMFWNNPGEELKFSNFSSMSTTITGRIISMRLKEFESLNIVSKFVDGGKTSYMLTQSGLELREVYVRVQEWTHSNSSCDCGEDCISHSQ